MKSRYLLKEPGAVASIAANARQNKQADDELMSVGNSSLQSVYQGFVDCVIKYKVHKPAPADISPVHKANENRNMLVDGSIKAYDSVEDSDGKLPLNSSRKNYEELKLIKDELKRLKIPNMDIDFTKSNDRLRIKTATGKVRPIPSRKATNTDQSKISSMGIDKSNHANPFAKTHLPVRKALTTKRILFRNPSILMGRTGINFRELKNNYQEKLVRDKLDLKIPANLLVPISKHCNGANNGSQELKIDFKQSCDLTKSDKSEPQKSRTFRYVNSQKNLGIAFRIYNNGSDKNLKKYYRMDQHQPPILSNLTQKFQSAAVSPTSSPLKARPNFKETKA